MPVGQEASGSAAYRSTFLDFINLPNPIEPNQPDTGSQKHPLNGPPRVENGRLANSTNPDLFRLILEPASERPAKRQSNSDANALNLPKPPVRNAAKRLRIPPTLSGLHQPPPDAGLLPSISVDQRQVPLPRQQEAVSQEKLAKPATRQEATVSDASVTTEAPNASGLIETSSKTQRKRMKRNKWTDEETTCLLKGVSKFGIGNWTKILQCTDYVFHNRTALDLKDRFRVCFPEKYRAGCVLAPSTPISITTEGQEQSSATGKSSTKGPRRERISASKLRQLGITEPFSKTIRRSRHGYTAEEDEALLRGFRKYGHSWAAMRQDPGLDLSHRRAPDLRDRFRTKYPEEYAKLCSTTQSDAITEETPLPLNDASNIPTSSGADALFDTLKTTAPASMLLAEGTDKDDLALSKQQQFASKKPGSVPAPLFSLDDLFLSGPFGAEDDGGSEPIVLDRGILDWATGDGGKSAVPDAAKSHGIDPRMTLKLPKPVSNMQTPITAPPLAVSAPTSAAPLPSLATLIPEIAPPEPQELPSLVQWLHTTDTDSRGGASTVPTLEELLS